MSVCDTERERREENKAGVERKTQKPLEEEIMMKAG